MNLIAIDQSLTATGIVIWTPTDGYIFKILSTKRTKNTNCPAIDYTRRIMYLRDEIEKLCLDYNVQKGIIEGMAFGSRSGLAFDLGGLGHASRMALIDCGVDFIVIPPKTAKRYFTGSGNTDKMGMIAEAHKRQVTIPYMKKYPGKIVDYDDNIVDAFAFINFLSDYHNNTLGADFLDKVEYSTDE